ncbi:MAG: 2-hydroxyacid dehydrogenase [Anaerolineae bacterium]|jgi:phosphoglycerate dehydrogenase-like enzyme
MRMSVHLVQPRYDTESLQLLRSQLHADIDLTTGPNPPDPAHYQILVAGRPQREHIIASPNLQALVIPWAGLPEPTRRLMLDFPHIAVHNLHHNALPVAEHAIALLLAAMKLIVPMDRSLRSHDWSPRYQHKPSLLVSGKRVLILGFGTIGHHVADLCEGLGMEVTAIQRHAEPPAIGTPKGIKPAPPEELHRLLPDTEALFVCLPHTAETTGLVGAEELSLLPAGAVLINIARGPIVDEAALYRALSEGRLYAAGLDVWYRYPDDKETRSRTPPADHPFHELDNVVMSPHRAGHTEETERLRMEHLAELLNAAAQGEPMPNRVDLQAGY